MQPKMHCSVEGKEFAAVTDRQNTDISRTRIETFTGVTLQSAAMLSTPILPEQ